MAEVKNKSRLLSDDEVLFIKKYTKQKDWSKITAKLNLKGVGISIVRQVIYQQAVMTETTAKVIDEIKGFAAKMKKAEDDFNNKYGV